MCYMIRAYCGDLIRSVELSGAVNRVSVGSAPEDGIQFSAAGLMKSQLVIQKSAKGYSLKGKHIYNSKGSRISSDTIREGNRYRIDCQPPVIISVHPRQADGNVLLGISQIWELTIGRGRGNDILLTHPKTSERHCVIVKKDGCYKIRDLGSSNGTYLNGTRIVREKTLRDGDVINLSIYQILFQNNALSFYNVGNDMDIAEEFEQFETQEQHGIQTKMTNDGGTISIFETENNGKASFGNRETVSLYDVNIRVNIDAKK